MVLRILNFSKFLLIFLLFISCSQNFQNREVKLFFPKNLVKIEGNHALLIKKNIFNVKQNILSDDCESWALNLELEKLFNNSFKQLSKKMFKNIKVIENTDKPLSKNEVYNSLVSLEKNHAYLDFKTEGNNGIFKIVLDSTFTVKGNNKEIKNNLNSKQTWEKNIFFNCDLSDGANKATEEAFRNLIEQAYSNIYESVFKVTR